MWPQALLFSERGVNSVAFNTECDDMMCDSGGGGVAVRTADFPPHKQRLPGFVVGFQVRLHAVLASRPAALQRLVAGCCWLPPVASCGLLRAGAGLSREVQQAWPCRHCDVT